jgi:DeoR/GlpR family transcriptional regulator of sugar metabolism
MLSYERQNQIIDLLKENQYVTVPFLCKKLYSSSATIRRDLSDMSDKGLLTRVRGGATRIDGINHDTPLFVRSNKNREKKKIIANLALSYIKDSKTIFMDSSSTVSFLAAKLGDFHNLTIITNGIVTSNLLNEQTSAKIFLCGGLIKTNSSIVGQVAIETIQNFRGDILFFSCCGLSPEVGLTEADEDNAVVKKQMMKSAKERILLVDSTKFSEEFFCKTCNIGDVDVIITDQKPSDHFLTHLPTSVKLLHP